MLQHLAPYRQIGGAADDVLAGRLGKRFGQVSPLPGDGAVCGLEAHSTPVTFVHIDRPHLVIVYRFEREITLQVETDPQLSIKIKISRAVDETRRNVAAPLHGRDPVIQVGHPRHPVGRLAGQQSQDTLAWVHLCWELLSTDFRNGLNGLTRLNELIGL